MALLQRSRGELQSNLENAQRELNEKDRMILLLDHQCAEYEAALKRVEQAPNSSGPLKGHCTDKDHIKTNPTHNSTPNFTGDQENAMICSLEHSSAQQPARRESDARGVPHTGPHSMPRPGGNPVQLSKSRSGVMAGHSKSFCASNSRPRGSSSTHCQVPTATGSTGHSHRSPLISDRVAAGGESKLRVPLRALSSHNSLLSGDGRSGISAVKKAIYTPCHTPCQLVLSIPPVPAL